MIVARQSFVDLQAKCERKPGEVLDWTDEARIDKAVGMGLVEVVKGGPEAKPEKKPAVKKTVKKVKGSAK